MKRITAFFAGISMLSIAARLLQLQGLHPLVWDEIEFFRATDWVRRGLVPYRDFWEHHTPLQWFLFAPVTALTNSPGVSAIVLDALGATAALDRRRSFCCAAGCAAPASPHSRHGRRWRWCSAARSSCCRPSSTASTCSDASSTSPRSYFLQRIDDGREVRVPRRRDALPGRLRQSATRTAGRAHAAAGARRAHARPRLGRQHARELVLRRRRRGVRPGAAFTSRRRIPRASRGSGCGATTSSPIDSPRRRCRLDVRHRFAVAFGLRLVGTVLEFSTFGHRSGGIAILVIGGIGVVRALRRGFRAPGDGFFLAFLQVANLLFIARDEVRLQLPPRDRRPADGAAGRHRDRSLGHVRPTPPRARSRSSSWPPRSTSPRPFSAEKKTTRVYEDFVMREVDRRTPAGSKVWDSVGWALHRDPAYRYWFLRANVFVMEEHGCFETYTIADLLRDPPAAVIADYDAAPLDGHAPAVRRTRRHALPPALARNLAARDERAPHARRTGRAWIVLADGTYDVYASPRLASHPWFRQPLDFERPLWRDVAPLSPADRGAHIDWFVDGAPIPPATTLTLRRGQRLDAISREPLPVGIMLIGSRKRCSPSASRRAASRSRRPTRRTGTFPTSTRSSTSPADIERDAARDPCRR